MICDMNFEFLYVNHIFLINSLPQMNFFVIQKPVL